MPKELLNHFIRGYFDGDGCVSSDGKYNNIVSFIGSPNFIKSLQEIMIDVVGLPKNKIGKSSVTDKVRIVNWSAKSDIRKIYEWLYPNSLKEAYPFLTRKKEKMKLIAYIPYKYKTKNALINALINSLNV